MSNAPVLIAYIPVLHEGYRRLITNHPEVETLYILGPELIAQFTHLAKEIRALDPALIQSAITQWHIIPQVKILDEVQLKTLAAEKTPVIAPREDVIEELVEKYLPENIVVFDAIFLRWDKHNTVQEHEVVADEEVSHEELDATLMQQAFSEAQKSSDWWRQIGGLVLKDGKVVLQTHNVHLPSPHTPYVDGDPRNNFHKGVNLELSTAFHVEAQLVAMAAQRGLSLEGSDMYVTTFPCPPCAKLVAHCGVKRLFFTEGYGVLDGERVLRDQGVRIIRVKV